MLFDFLGKTAIAPIQAIGSVLDNLFTSDDERLTKQVMMQRLALKPAMAQVELNKVEASSRSVFVAGWRPFFGWVGGFAFLYNYVVRDLLAWVMVMFTPDLAPPPSLGLEEMGAVVMGMLGLSGYRTFEKTTGKAK